MAEQPNRGIVHRLTKRPARCILRHCWHSTGNTLTELRESPHGPFAPEGVGATTGILRVEVRCCRCGQTRVFWRAE